MGRSALGLMVVGLVVAACGATPAQRSAPAAPAQAGAAASLTAAKAAAVRCDPKRTTATYAPDAAAINGPTVASIRKRGRLVVGTSADVLLWGARDPRTSQLDGFDIRVAKQIAKAIFGDENKIEYRVINYAQRPVALGGQGGAPTVDLVAHTYTINCERWQQIAFSAEYYRAGQRVLVARDSKARSIKDLAGARVCVAAGSTNLKNLDDYPEVAQHKVVVDELGQCLVKFQEGEADAITGDDTVLAGFAAQDPFARVIGPQFSAEPYGLGIPAGNVDFVRFVNAVLAKLMVDGIWADIYRATMGTVQPAVPAPPAPIYGR